MLVIRQIRKRHQRNPNEYWDEILYQYGETVGSLNVCLKAAAKDHPISTPVQVLSLDQTRVFEPMMLGQWLLPRRKRKAGKMGGRARG